VQTIVVLNGPNLGRLGSREPDIYGDGDLTALRDILRRDAAETVSVDVRQTDDESKMIAWLHEAADAHTPVIMNPAAFTHYSYALRDAVALVTSGGTPVIEVHITNPHARESFRHTSVISAAASGVIAGFGFDSYRLALTQLRRND
jgi:3-dehydroquinate dehydratase-2